MSGNYLKAISSIANLTGFFGSGGPDPAEVRYQELVSILNKIMENQQKILKTIEKLKNKIVEIHKTEMI